MIRPRRNGPPKVQQIGPLAVELQQAPHGEPDGTDSHSFKQDYTDLYDFAPVGYCTLSPTGTIVGINLAGAALLNADRAALLNKPIRGVVQSIDYELFWSRLRRCIEYVERDRFEIEIVTRGDRRLVLDVQAGPLLDDGGKPTACLIALVDITRRKNAEEAMQYLIGLSKRLSSLLPSSEALSTIAQALVPFPASACLVSLNETSMSQFSSCAVHIDSEKSPIFETLARNQVFLPSLKHGLERVRREGTPLLIDSLSPADMAILEMDPILRAWTEELKLSSFALLPLSTAEQTVGALCLGRTSSVLPFEAREVPFLKEVAWRCSVALENIRLYEAALRAVRVRDEFVAIVSHDLSSAVSALSLTSSGLVNNGPKADRRKAGGRQDWLRVQRAAQWMQRLIQRLLDISVIESGRFSVSASAEPVDDLIASVFEIVELLAAAKHVSLKKETPKQIWVAADKERIQQVLSNLIANAIKFSPHGGTVTVSVETGDRVSFSVIDQGAGISAEDRKHIFDRFWQAKRSRNAGVGLGLAISRGIVRAHGGDLWVESEVGHGSAFRFTLASCPPPSEADRWASRTAAPTADP